MPLTVIVAAFIGGVIALQTRYQLLPGVQLSIIGLATRLMIMLELGPLLTGLVLTGRVGARMTAEIGTMRVTEQIDALETLAYDPVAFLIVPRLLAAIVMLPVLVVLADATGVLSGYLVSVNVTDVTPQEFIEGLATRLRHRSRSSTVAQGDDVRRGHRVRLLLRGLHYRGRRRGRRSIDGEGGRHRFRHDPRARCADGGVLSPLPANMKRRDEVSSAFSSPSPSSSCLLGTLWLVRGGL